VSLPDSPSGTATPKSTESEQSEALDYIPSAIPASVDQDGISLPFFDEQAMAQSVVGEPLPPYQPVPDPTLHADPTMKDTFGLDFGSFGMMTGLGEDAASLLGLTGTEGVMKQYQPQILQDAAKDVIPLAGGPAGDLQNFIASIDWKTFGVVADVPTSTPATIQPSQLVHPRPDLKRKTSGDASPDILASPASLDGPVAKKPRGRPPKAKTTPTSTTSRRLSNLPTPTSTQTQSLHLSPPTSPKTQAKNASSTARPKSVVPEKFFKDNHAQTLLGMTKAQICSYPTFEDLLADVVPALRAGAEEFGHKIAEGRDRAKDAAKKSRDEKRGLIVGLEERVGELEDEVKGLRGLLKGLVEKGLVGSQDLAGMGIGLGLSF
jgi:hypothetical protein